MDPVVVVMLEECGNGVEGQVFDEPVRGPTSRSKWETTANGGKDCRGFGSSTRHKRVRAGRGKLATRTWRWVYRVGGRRMKGWSCQARVWCAKSKPRRRCHRTSYNAVAYLVRGEPKESV